MQVNPSFYWGLIVGAGSALRAAWSFYEIKRQKKALKWDWIMFSKEVFVALGFGYIIGFAMQDEFELGRVVLAFLSGAGISSLQTKGVSAYKRFRKRT
jgi:hypothetical protein